MCVWRKVANNLPLREQKEGVIFGGCTYVSFKESPWKFKHMMFSSEQYPQVDIISLTGQMKKLKNIERQIYLTKFVHLKNKRKKRD